MMRLLSIILGSVMALVACFILFLAYRWANASSEEHNTNDAEKKQKSILKNNKKRKAHTEISIEMTPMDSPSRKKSVRFDPLVEVTQIQKDFPPPAPHHQDFPPPAPYRQVSENESFEDTPAIAKKAKILKKTVEGPYADVRSKIVLNQYWMEHNIRLRYDEVFQALFEATPQLRELCFDSGVEIIQEVCRVGFCEEKWYNHLQRFWNDENCEKGNVALAFLLILKYETSDGIMALLHHVGDQVTKCETSKRQGVSFLVMAGGKLLENPNTERETKWDDLLTEANFPPHDFPKGCDDIPETKEALRRIHKCVQVFVDNHKEKAFSSAAQEPARFYFHLIDSKLGKKHVGMHGVNGYMAMFETGLGVRFQTKAMVDDNDIQMGLADHWTKLDEGVFYDHFAHQEHFGKSFESIKALRNGGDEYLKQSQDWATQFEEEFREFDNPGASPHMNSYSNSRMNLRSNPRVDPAFNPWFWRGSDIVEHAIRGDDKLFKYMHFFAYFFTKEFLVRRMFENLNAEIQVEYVGFCKAAAELYQIYKDQYNFPENSLVEHLYDESFIELDVDRTTDFFAWLGVCKEQTEIQVDSPGRIKNSTDKLVLL